MVFLRRGGGGDPPIHATISLNLENIPLVNPFAEVFLFGDFNIHHKDSPTYSGGTGRPGELSSNFLISNNFTLIVNFPSLVLFLTIFPHNLLLLDLFPSLVFVLHGFPSIEKFWSCCLSFHWLSFYLKIVCAVTIHKFLLFLYWSDALWILLTVCDWFQIGIIVYIHNQKY